MRCLTLHIGLLEGTMSGLVYAVLFLFLVAVIESSQEDGKDGKVIRYATYHVDQLYQACPPAGKNIML